MTDQIVLLDIEGVDPPSDAARDVIDPDKIRELAESIRSQGLLQPILVRPLNGRFEVVAGHRRYLAHRLIGEVKIKSIIRELSDEDTFLIRAMENDQREDLNPIEKAKVYKKLQDKFNWTTRVIASKMGRSHQTIMRYLKLLEVPEEFQDAVARGKLSIQVALCLVNIDDLGFRKFYFESAVFNGVTLEVAEGWVNDYNKTRLNLGPGEGGGMEALGIFQASLPIYHTCPCCLGPVEVTKVRYLGVCPECETQVKGALAGNKSH
jgi:ParB family chromosome partitioning protein